MADLINTLSITILAFSLIFFIFISIMCYLRTFHELHDRENEEKFLKSLIPVILTSMAVYVLSPPKEVFIKSTFVEKAIESCGHELTKESVDILLEKIKAEFE
jgi:hypothetical protein